MKEKDIKLVWGRAASRCSICKVELSQDANYTLSSFSIGEQAHIVGEKETAARGNSSLTTEERNSYHNIILLCPNHHTEIDKNEADWSVEQLYLIKSEHELWVKENLSESTDSRLQADQLAITSLIDGIVSKANLIDWNDWVGEAYGADGRLPIVMSDMYSLRKRVAASIVPPAFEEIGRSAVTLSILLLKFCDTFMEHSDDKGDYHFAEKFYKSSGFNPRYREDLEEWRQWVNAYSDLLVESTKAANWFAELIRRDINPLFFVEHGKFIVNQGLGMDLNYHATIPEFTETEKRALPGSLL